MIVAQSMSALQQQAKPSTTNPAKSPEFFLRNTPLPAHAAVEVADLLAIQPKLKVDAANSPLEQEADRAAEHVMRMPDAKPGDTIQRNEQPQIIQTACTACRSGKTEDEEKRVSREEASGQTPEVTARVESQIQSLRGCGKPLPESVRSFFEPRFGRDFSNVRVHTESAAAVAANRINARAFAMGNDIAFGVGEFVPRSESGKRLIAHELTHIVQNGGSADAHGSALNRHPAARVVEKVGSKAFKWLSKRGKNVSAHIAKGHVANRLGKSTFLKGGKETKKLIERTIRGADNVVDQGRRLRLEKSFGRKVGKGGENIVTVIIEKATGKIVTAFPSRTLIAISASAATRSASAAKSADEQIEDRRKALDRSQESLLDFIFGVSQLGVPEDEVAESEIIRKLVDSAIADIEFDMQRSLSEAERGEVEEVIITGMQHHPQPG